MGLSHPTPTIVLWAPIPNQGQNRLHQQTQHPLQTPHPFPIHWFTLLGTPLWSGQRNSDRSNDKGKGTNTNNSTTPNSDKNKNNNSNNKNNSGNSNTLNTTGNTNSSNSNQKKPNSDLSSKLGKDSKLTQQERQHCFDQNLCLFCGKGGHVVKDCSKAMSSAAKGCSATVMDKTSKAKSGSKPKNLWAVFLTLHWLRTALNSLVQLQSHNSMHLLFIIQTPLQSPLPMTLFWILRSTPS